MKKRNRRHFTSIFRRTIPVLAAVIIITFFITITSVGAAENKKEQTYKYYTSVQIMPGDSLWSIANEYCYDCDMSVEEYIKEIRSINQLNNDTINSGEYLIVFYYGVAAIN